MTDVVISQLPAEVLQTNLDPEMSFSQLPVEVLQTNLSPNLQLAQFIVEILRPSASYVDKKRTVYISC